MCSQYRSTLHSHVLIVGNPQDLSLGGPSNEVVVLKILLKQKRVCLHADNDPEFIDPRPCALHLDDQYLVTHGEARYAGKV